MRQEVLVALKIGKSLRYDEKEQMFVIDLKGFGKNRNNIFVKIPKTETSLFRRLAICCVELKMMHVFRWINIYRPVLMDQSELHDYLFVSESGLPRKEISYIIRSTQVSLWISHFKTLISIVYSNFIWRKVCHLIHFVPPKPHCWPVTMWKCLQKRTRRVFLTP